MMVSEIIFLEIVIMLAKEDGMKATAFYTIKGISIFVAVVLVGVKLVQPLLWGLASGFIVGLILVTFFCREKKSVAEVIANMSPEKQMKLVQKIITAGIGLSKITPTWLLGSPVPQSTDDRGTKRTKLDQKPYDGQTVTLPNGNVATREEILLALRDYLVKDMGMSVSK